MPADMKETIAKAAQSLLFEHHVKKLTVKDIVERCHITRQAFYYHFEDIPDLFRWMLEKRTEQNCSARSCPEKAQKKGCVVSLLRQSTSLPMSSVVWIAAIDLNWSQCCGSTFNGSLQW